MAKFVQFVNNVPIYKAIKANNTALSLDDNDAVNYEARGLALAKKSDISQAISDYSKAIDLRHKSAEIWKPLWNDEDYGKKPLAQDYFMRGLNFIIRSGPLASSDEKQAIAYITNGIEDFDKAIELNPKHGDA